MILTRPTIVYVSGPITTGGNVPVNVRNGILAAMTIRKRGYVVICPHERIVTEMLDPHDYEWWMERDFAEIEAADVVYRMSDALGRAVPSAGGDREVEYARKLGRPVYYSLDTLCAGVPSTRAVLTEGGDFCYSCGGPLRRDQDHTRCRGSA